MGYISFHTLRIVQKIRRKKPNMRKTISLFLAVLMMLVLLPAVRLNGTAAAESATYTKVISAADLTDGGSYLIVAESKSKVFNGTAYTAGNAVAATISLGTITGDYSANEIVISSMTGGYSLKNSQGKYLSGNSSSNTVVFGDTAVANTINLSNGAATIKSNSKQLLHNTQNDGFFRFYNPSNASNSQYVVPSLFKKNESVAPSGEVIVPASHEIPFGQVDSAISCKNDTSAGINFSFNPVSPMKNADGDELAWTVNGGGAIAAGNTFQLTVHIHLGDTGRLCPKGTSD